MILLIQVILITAITWQAHNVTNDWFFSLSFGIVATLATGAVNAVYRISRIILSNVIEMKMIIQAMEEINTKIMENAGFNEEEIKHYQIKTTVKRNYENFHHTK